VLVTVGQLSKLIARGAIDAGMPIGSVVEFDDSVQAAKEIAGSVRERDVVLVKGSRAIRMEKVVEVLLAAA
jgi:UDP-N-acetylmuramoyl-tripeptide--D-alanyl-D-alanine ligase